MRILANVISITVLLQECNWLKVELNINFQQENIQKVHLSGCFYIYGATFYNFFILLEISGYYLQRD